MINIDNYIECFLKAAKDVYGERLVYVGLQGSYLRGEAHENSDIDIMVLIDGFSVSDMDQYREILNRIGHVEKSCGFICGKDDMMNWNPLESIQLQYTTKDLYGTLTDFLPAATREDEINYVKLSIGNLFHEICHRYIHGGREKSALKLRETCKGLFFIIQNLYYLESGDFVGTKKALKERVSDEDRAMLELAELPDDYDFDAAYDSLFKWCQKTLIRLENI